MAPQWMPIPLGLPRDPKIRRLAKGLGVRRTEAIGLWVSVLHFAAEFASDGDLSGFDCDEIADGALWHGEPESFLDALVTAHLLERIGDRLVVIDWQTYGGRYEETRAKWRERKQRQRERDAQRKHLSSNGASADGGHGAVPRDGHGDVTGNVTETSRHRSTHSQDLPDEDLPDQRDRHTHQTDGSPRESEDLASPATADDQGEPDAGNGFVGNAEALVRTYLAFRRKTATREPSAAHVHQQRAAATALARRGGATDDAMLCLGWLKSWCTKKAPDLAMVAQYFDQCDSLGQPATAKPANGKATDDFVPRGEFDPWGSLGKNGRADQ